MNSKCKCGVELRASSADYPGKYEGELLHPCTYWQGLCQKSGGCCECAPTPEDRDQTRERSAGCAYLL